MTERPAGNAETQAALRFHAATTYRALPGAGGEPEYVMGTPPDIEDPIWQQDWSIEPRPYKVYPTLEPIELAAELLQTQLPTLEAIARSGLEPPETSTSTAVPDRAALAQLCRLSNGLLHRRIVTSISRRVVEFRTAAATGARYHLELYIVCGDLPDLPAGVYHYATQDHRLRQLRAGDLRGVLVAASGGEPSLAQAPAALLMTSTFWRNAWRYKARAYRHTFWDAGTSLANLLAVAASLGLPARLVLGFADADVNRLLGIDGRSEATVAMCALGADRPAPPAPDVLEMIDPPVEPVSAREVIFPDIGRLHAASALASGQEAAAWRRAPLRRSLPPATGRLIRLEPLAADQLPTAPVEATILARRSARHYDTETPLSFEMFSTVLDRSTRSFAADCLDPAAPPLHDGYLIVNAVEGLEPGLYLHRARAGRIEFLRGGTFRTEAAHLAFDQSYAGDAHVNSYALTQLGPLLATYGNRGYRLAQLEAALFAGRLHLAAYALGLGAVALTSFDDEVIELFSPRAADADFLFITVFGVRRRRAS